MLPECHALENLRVFPFGFHIPLHRDFGCLGPVGIVRSHFGSPFDTGNSLCRPNVLFGNCLSAVIHRLHLRDNSHSLHHKRRNFELADYNLDSPEYSCWL